jgi:hypothetical protein
VIQIPGNAAITAKGSSAIDLSYGAGSGGAIYLRASELAVDGLISVRGGMGMSESSAGGGGRVSINVSASVIFLL